MKRFFNMIPGKDGCCILMYGDIGEYSKVRSADITRELIEAEAQYSKIDVRINSYGGDVYTGIAIFNALRNSSADITIYIDGVAASMASVIALCGKRVEMSRYARLMLHGVQGGCYGNKKEIEECLKDIEVLENTLCGMYAEKLSKTPEEIKNEYFDGTDHWLTAEEALSLGFIDNIYDADPVPEDSSPEQIYNTFNNRLEAQSQNQREMNLDELRKRPAFSACASEEDVIRQINHLETEAAKVPDLTKQNTAMQERINVFENKAKEETAESIKKCLDDAEAAGRINQQTRPTYQALLEKDFENGSIAIQGLPAKKRVMNNLGGQPEGESPWEKLQRQIRENKKN